MTSDDGARDGFEFDRFCCLPRSRELLKDGSVVELGARAFEILVHLLENPGRTVSKADLFQAIWAGRIVEGNNLTVQMSAVRRALGGVEQAKQYLLTVPGVGYRFIAPVRKISSSENPRADAAEVTPPFPLPMSRSGNLPVPATSFVGRHREIAEIGKRLGAARLLTLTGIGGIGKTRVALEFGKSVVQDYADGVWLIDLAQVNDSEAIYDAIGMVFSIAGNLIDPELSVVKYLTTKDLLLIFDNCEHLTLGIARAASRILLNCGAVRIIATSREILGVNGESVLRISTLSFPASPALTVDDALDYDAIKLFSERAGMTIDGFVLDDETMPAVIRICARLDGIALAIEMAVPWLRIFKPAELADQLQERFRLLSSSDRGALPRQRTLRSMIDWSYEALAEEGRALLRQLSVFAGSMNFYAIQAVAAGICNEEAAIPGVVSRLVETSLVVVEPAGATLRFRLLETIKHYAADRLRDCGEIHRYRRHAEHYLQLFEVAEAEWATSSTSSWSARYLSEAENFRAALDWAFGPDGDEAIGLRLVSVSYPLWWDLPQLPLREGRKWFEHTLPRLLAGGVPDPVAARLWLGLSWQDMRNNDRENHTAAGHAVAAFRRTGEPLGLGAALWRLGTTKFHRGSATATLGFYQEVERILRPEGPSRWLALALIKIGDVHQFNGELDAAYQSYEEAIALSDALDQWYPRTICTTNMSELLFSLGRGDEAIDILLSLHDESVPSRRVPSLAPLASHLLLAGRTQEMAEAVDEALELASTIGFRASMGWVAETLALHLAEHGDLQRAAQFAGYARLVHPMPDARVGSRLEVFRRLQSALNADLPVARIAALAADGAAWSEGRVAAEGQAVCRAALSNI